MLLRCYDGVSGSIIILLRSLAFSDFIRTFATMNKNINLKIVWAVVRSGHPAAFLHTGILAL